MASHNRRSARFLSHIEAADARRTCSEGLHVESIRTRTIAGCGGAAGGSPTDRTAR